MNRRVSELPVIRGIRRLPYITHRYARVVGALQVIYFIADYGAQYTVRRPCDRFSTSSLLKAHFTPHSLSPPASKSLGPVTTPHLGRSHLLLAAPDWLSRARARRETVENGFKRRGRGMFSCFLPLPAPCGSKTFGDSSDRRAGRTRHQRYRNKQRSPRNLRHSSARPWIGISSSPPRVPTSARDDFSDRRFASSHERADRASPLDPPGAARRKRSLSPASAAL